MAYEGLQQAHRLTLERSARDLLKFIVVAPDHVSMAVHEPRHHDSARSADLFRSARLLQCFDAPARACFVDPAVANQDRPVGYYGNFAHQSATTRWWRTMQRHQLARASN